MNVLDGGNFGSGFASGAVSSLISSGVQGLHIKGKDFKNVLTIASGGISSSIAGGNFWAGVRQGLITSGLNHVGHLAIQPKTKIIGIYGAGEVNNSQNQELKKIVESRGGTMYGDELTFGAETIDIDEIVKSTKRGTHIEIYGYSRGGNEAVDLAVRYGSHGIVVHKLVLFDAHSFTGDLSLHHANVKQVFNFYQKNPTTSGELGWWGENPYNGNPLNLKGNPFTYVKNGMIHFDKVNTNINQILIQNPTVTHQNIIEYVNRYFKF